MAEGMWQSHVPIHGTVPGGTLHDTLHLTTDPWTCPSVAPPIRRGRMHVVRGHVVEGAPAGTRPSRAEVGWPAIRPDSGPRDASATSKVMYLDSIECNLMSFHKMEGSIFAPLRVNTNVGQHPRDYARSFRLSHV